MKEVNHNIWVNILMIVLLCLIAFAMFAPIVHLHVTGEWFWY